MGLMDEVRRLSKVSARDELATIYQPLGMSEYELMKEALVAMSQFQIGERVIALPGLTRNMELILQCIGDFKKKLSRSVVPPEVVTSDTITVEPLRPEIFGLDTYKQTGLSTTAGTYHIIPTAADTVWEAKKDEEIVVITDFIEFLTTINVTAIRAVNLDGEKGLRPEELRLNLKGSDLQIYQLKRPWISDVTLDLDGKVEADGDSELTPFGVHICLGTRFPGLT